MGHIAGYRFKIYYGETLIHEDDTIYEEESDAKQAGAEYMDDKILQWESDGSWTKEDNKEFFDIVIIDEIKDKEDEV